MEEASVLRSFSETRSIRLELGPVVIARSSKRRSMGVPGMEGRSQPAPLVL